MNFIGAARFITRNEGSDEKEEMTARDTTGNSAAAPSRGRYANSGNGPSLHPIDIAHDDYVGLVDPDTAFWSLVRKDKLAATLNDQKFLSAYRRKAARFADEMEMLRFGLKPSAGDVSLLWRQTAEWTRSVRSASSMKNRPVMHFA